MAIKSSTCFGKKSKKPLTEYWSEGDAREAAAEQRSRYGGDLMPYRCSRCDAWHLAPKGRHTPSTPCRQCTGSEGEPKMTYRSEKEAERRAGILLKEKGVRLRVYLCPGGGGWHLTKGGW